MVHFQKKITGKFFLVKKDLTWGEGVRWGFGKTTLFPGGFPDPFPNKYYNTQCYIFLILSYFSYLNVGIKNYGKHKQFIDTLNYSEMECQVGHEEHLGIGVVVGYALCN